MARRGERSRVHPGRGTPESDASISSKKCFRSGFASGRFLPVFAGLSHIQIGDGEGVVADELAAWLDDITHELGKDVIGLVELTDVDLE